MRSVLDGLYSLCMVAAGFSLVAIGVIVAFQMVTRGLGVHTLSVDEFAGFSLVATTFLGLGPTYRASSHIRVSLLIDRFKGRPRRLLECLGMIVSGGLTAWACYWIGVLVWDSWTFGESSQGLVPTPLWLPQSAMLLGILVFCIAIIDDLAAAARGGKPSYLAAEEAQRDEVVGGGA